IYFKITYLYVFKIYATSNYALYEETLPNCFIFSGINYLYLFPSRYWNYQSTITIGYSSLKSNLAKSYRWYFNSKDRKSTRLNSSHVKISYAVFCLKKKK